MADDPADDHLLVDARGRSCPVPVIELARAIERAPVGARILLLATDPAARIDVPVWCRMQRHRLLEAEQDGTQLRFVVERAR